MQWKRCWTKPLVVPLAYLFFYYGVVVGCVLCFLLLLQLFWLGFYLLYFLFQSFSSLGRIPSPTRKALAFRTRNALLANVQIWTKYRPFKPIKICSKIYTQKNIHPLLSFIKQITTFKKRNLRKMKVFSQSDVIGNQIKVQCKD